MARHRDVRNMDYSEDYDGYDDIYGHSVDDDYYISPSNRQFMYNRENSGQLKSGDGHPMEQDIQEEDTEEEETKLSESDRAKLDSCLDYVKSIFAPMSMPRQEIVKIIIDNKYESEKILNAILEIQSRKPSDRRDKDDTILVTHSMNGLKKYKNPNSKVINNLPLTSQNPEEKIDFSNKFLSNLNTTQGASLKNCKNPLNFINNDNSKDMGFDCVDAALPIIRNSESKNIRTSPSISFFSKIEDCGGSDSTMNRRTTNGVSFLSKIRSKDDINSNKATNFSDVSFLSKIMSPQKDPSNSSSGLSFISRIRKPVDLNLDSQGSSVDSSTPDTSPQLSFLSKIKKHSSGANIESKNVDGFLNNFVRCLNVSKTNEDDENLKINTFVGSIKKNQGVSSLEPRKNGKLIPTFKTQSLSEDLSRLKVTEVHSSPILRNVVEKNGFDIDLSTALRKNNSETFKLKVHSSTDDFDLPFISCEEDLQMKGYKRETLMCSLDVSALASGKVFYSKKRPSQLGKMLGLRFRISKSKICKKKKFKLDPSLVRFDFSSLSPDDQILRHKRRNL